MTPVSATHAQVPALAFNNMPIEWLEQVLSFVSLKDLQLNCCLVNKEWKQAVDYVVSQWPTLFIADYDRKRWENVARVIHIRERESELIVILTIEAFESMLRTLSRMTSVRVDLDVMGRICNISEVPLSHWQSLMDQVTVVSITSCRILQEELTYPRITCLDLAFGWRRDADLMTRFPNLHSLTGGKTVSPEVLASIQKPEQMRKLGVRLRVDPHIDNSVRLIAEMTNLEHLSVISETEYLIGDEQHAASLLPLYTAFKKLNHFAMCARAKNAEANDAAVEALVQQNPGLRFVMFRWVMLTDRALVSLSQLTDLRRVIFSDHRASFTKDGLLSLLRGRSRHKLNNLQFSARFGPGGKEALVHEWKVIMGETGRSIFLNYEPPSDLIICILWGINRSCT